MKKSLFLILTTLFLYPGMSNAQVPDPPREEIPPCHRSEHDRIVFLKGDWDVSSRQRINFTEDRWNESTGKATWRSILGGCAFCEEWSGVLDGESMKWIQILTYNHREEKWEQAMIDWAHGNLITAEGFYDEGKLIFNAPQIRKGELLIDRTTIEKIDEDNVKWTMETSLDGGATWITFWTMLYSRR